MCLSPGGRRGWLGALALAAAVGVVGCGGGKGNISGKVTHKGAPLKGGRVGFMASNKQNFIAEINEDGSYAVSNVPTGPAKVSVQTSYLRMTARTSRSYKVPADAPPGLGGGGGVAKDRYVPVPPSVEDPDTSGITFDVKKGDQTFDIDVK
jgi:hypothetical protein